MSQHTFRQHYRSFSTLRRGRAFVPGSVLNGCNQVEVRGNGSAGTICACSRVNLTKAAMIAVMREFDRPVSSAELYAIWDGEKPLQVFEYHLLSLVKAGVAEPLVTKPEILFCLVSESDESNS